MKGQSGLFVRLLGAAIASIGVLYTAWTNDAKIGSVIVSVGLLLLAVGGAVGK